jgi:hypothetical protein
VAVAVTTAQQVLLGALGEALGSVFLAVAVLVQRAKVTVAEIHTHQAMAVVAAVAVLAVLEVMAVAVLPVMAGLAQVTLRLGLPLQEQVLAGTTLAVAVAEAIK